MEKKLSLSFFILLINLCSFQVFSQQNLGKISGLVCDEQNHPLEYATIFITNEKDSLITGTTTNKNGKFEIANIHFGTVGLKASFIGYKPYSTEGLIINSDNLSLRLDTIKLFAKSEEIDAVTVTANKNNVKVEINKTTFAVTRKMLQSSVSSQDLLKQIPGISVDEKNNSISLNNKGNVLILVNGIPQRDSKIAAKLKAEGIKEVEIVSSPSVKYDSENIGGIVNIIMDNERNKGLTGSFTLDHSYENKYHDPTFDLRYGMKSLTFFAGYSLYQRDIRKQIEIWDEINKDNETIFFYSKGQYTKKLELGHSFNYGFDYYINKKNIFNFYGQYDYDNVDYITKYDNQLENLTGLSQIYSSTKSDLENYYGQNYSLFYKHLFNKDDHDLTVDINYFNLRHDMNVDYENVYTGQSIYRNEKTDNHRRSLNLSIDYTLPLSKNTIIEIGSKSYVQEMDNVFINSNSEEFLYSEFRQAAYVNVLTSFLNLNFQAGLRNEYSSIWINSDTKNTTNKLLPNVSIFKKINKANNIKLSANKNIIRPDIWILNPFIEQQDSLHIMYGNPFLKPVLTNNIELGYTLSLKNLYLSTTAYYSYTNDDFGQLIKISDNELFETTTENINVNKQYGVKIYSSFTFKNLSLKPNFVVYNQSINPAGLQDYGIEKSEKLSWSASVSLNYSFLKTWGFYSTYRFKSPFIVPQGEIISTNSLHLFLSKTLFNKKGRIMLMVWNPFGPTKRESIYTGYNFTRRTAVHSDDVLYHIRFNYFFGADKKVKKIDRKYNTESNF